MAQPDAQMIDATWLLCQRAQALKEWACLEFFHQHATDVACYKLHESCGKKSLHSLKLKALIEVFCKNHMVFIDILEQDTISPSDVNVLFACGDKSPSDCIQEAICMCEHNGWTLNLSWFGQ